MIQLPKNTTTAIVESINVLRWIILVGLIWIVFVFSASCTQSTPIPTPTPLPEKPLPTIAAWNGFTASTICLETALSFPEYRGRHQTASIEDATRDILTRMGMKVVNAGSPCDASLNLTIDGEELSAKYMGMGNLPLTCYTGAELDGQLTFKADGKKTLVFPITGQKEPSNKISEGSCDSFPGEFSFIYIWGQSLVESLSQIWGSQALVFGVDYWYEGIYGKGRVFPLREIGLSDEVVTALIYALDDENPRLRERAVYEIMYFAPQGKEVIPNLIQHLDDESYGVRLAAVQALGKFGSEAESAIPKLKQMYKSYINLRHYIKNTLEAITGKNYW